MRFRLLAVALLLLASLVEAAPPVASCIPSRTTGTAPLFVHVDCSGTTDADSTTPFHTLLYRHNFGDAGAGYWSYGTDTTASKNNATGPITGHIYETAGTYILTSTVTDGLTQSNRRVTNTITVSNPDTTYAGTATVCFFNASVGSGCPAGATQTTTSDFDADVAPCLTTTKRCLMKRGDTFTLSTAVGLSGPGPTTLGAYGSGALPIVNVGAGNSMNFNGTIDDVRIMDLDIRGTSGNTFSLNADASGITMLRLTIAGGGLDNGIELAAGSSAVSNTVIQDSTLSGSDNGQEIHIRCATKCAILGNSLGPNTTTGFQTFRADKMQKSVIAYNTFDHNGATNVEVVAIRAETHVTNADDTFYLVFSDNKITEGTRTAGPLVHYGPGSGGDARIYDVIHERNWHVASAYTGATAVVGLTVSAVRVTVRNNLVDLSLPVAALDRVGVSVGQIGTEPVPNDVQLLNNTIYSSQTGTAAGDGFRIFATATSTVVKNNLCRGVSLSSCVNDAGTGTVASNNSTTPQTTGTDPLFDGPNIPPYGFRPGTSSYATTAGTAVFPSSNDDFFNCDDVTANEHIGAFISRTRSRCHVGVR